MTRFLTASLLALFLVSPVPALAQEADPNLIPVFFFLHHNEEQPLGILAVTPLFAAEDENGDYFERWLTVYVPATTTYPSQYYNLTSATSTRLIFLPDGDLIALFRV